MTEAPRAPHRGNVWVYALAFVAVLGAGAAIAVASIGSLQSTRALWVSMGLSYLAIVLAILALLLPGARR